MDIIQKKLELIDKKLALSPRYIVQQIICKAPLVFLAVGLIIGIGLQNYLHLPFTIWLIILAIFALLAIAAFVVRKSSTSTYVIAFIAFFCFICLGAVRLASFYRPRPSDITNLVSGERSLATVRGIIITEPYINDYNDWKFSSFKFTDPPTSFYLELTDAETTEGWQKVTGTIRVQVEEPVLDLKAGDYVQLYCWLERFSPPTNPGQFDLKKYLARKNIRVAASVKSSDAIELLQSHHKGAFTRIKRVLQQKTSQVLLSDVEAGGSSRAMLEALLLGLRQNIDSETYLAFRKTGLLHFISLSGMHFGILIAVIWWLCKTAGMLKRSRSAVCIIASILFLLIIPPRAPAIRAAVISIVFCASFFFRRRPNPFNSLSLAAIILLLVRPTQLYQAGFQLSFATVLGILLFYERISFFLYEKINHFIDFNALSEKTFLFRAFGRILFYTLELFSVGFSAWLGGAGILLYHFHTITPLASIWTVIAFPFVALILAVGFLKIFISLLLPTLGSFLALFVSDLSSLLIALVKLFAKVSISQILIGHISIVFIVFYYVTIVFISFFRFRRPVLKRIITTALILVLLTTLFVTKWDRTHRRNLILTCIDVGHGQSILVQLPGKTNLLFDAGSLYKSDPGRRIILPFLNFAGLNRIDTIHISHFDIDHINAIPEVIEGCSVGPLFVNEVFFDSNDLQDTQEFLIDALAESNRRIEKLNHSPSIKSPAKITILWPDTGVKDYQKLSDNDKSTVYLLEFAGRKILLCSDIEKPAQQMLFELYPNLKADVVFVPHHGSINTLELSFLEKLQASILICSCGQSQIETEPLSLVKGEKFETVRDGAITISIDPAGRIKSSSFIKQKQPSLE